MLSELSSWLELFPFSNIYSGKKRKQMEIQWSKAHAPISLHNALNAYLFLSFFICLLFLIFSFLFLSDIFLSVGCTLILFSLLLLFGFRLPPIFANQYAKKIESDLPVVLRAISLHLKINLPFEKAIEHAANSNYASSRLWKECLLLIMSGKSVPSSLSQIASETNSLTFSRALHQLSIIYGEGVAPDTLDSMADEITSQQLSSTRLQSSRIAIIGLFFVSTSCLLPAFFLILNVAASPLLGLPSSPFSVWLFYLLALPLLNLIVLFLMLSLSPTFSSSQKSKSLSKDADELMAKAHIPKFGTSRLFLLSLFLGLFGIIFFSLIGFGSLSFLLSLALASIPWAIRAYFEANAHSQLSSLESELPNILLAGSSSNRFVLETMLEHASNCPSISLSEQSSAVLRQIRAGANPQKVLAQWAERTPSIMLSRALSLFIIGYQTGGKLQKALSTSAQDLLSSFSLVRERANLLSIQNYTLIAAGALLVPAILSISLSFSTQIAQMQTGYSLSENILGAPADSTIQTSSNISDAQNSNMPSSQQSSSDSSSPSSQNSDSLSLVRAAQAAIPIYLFINCILISLFISLSQGSKEKFIHYAVLLSLISQAVWLLAGGVVFS